MKRVWHWMKMVYFALLFLSAGAAFMAATFAWFTANEKVETSRVTSRTGSAQLELQISRENFSPSAGGEVALKAPTNALMPVSTNDLSSFVYCPLTNDGYAQRFLPADETLYYHDTIYLRASGDGLPDGTKLALYLDDAYSITQSLQGELLTAARLGLRFDDGTAKILSLSDVNDGPGNTRLNGVVLGSGKVITLSGGTAQAADDPAAPLADFLISNGSTPLAELELNRVYRVDIYFYLEGCDPDCTGEKVALDTASLQLAFYGVSA